MGSTGTVLILGGTAEGRMLAGALHRRGFRVISALAGRTSRPVLPPGAVRLGGFGGAEGLADYLRAEGVGLLIDATHPFAARISANAVRAATAAGVPMLRWERPAWAEPEDAPWLHAADLEAAAALLPAGARVFLTVGRQELGAFLKRTDCRFLARMIEAPPPLPANWTVLRARGPFLRDEEEGLMVGESISHLVSKNSGGEGTAAKLEAARALGVTVVMVDRPVLPPAPTAASLDEVLALEPFSVSRNR